eukprot:COSAG06_NODE_473_length_15308_cov_162.912952_2_plen_212_part_00
MCARLAIPHAFLLAGPGTCCCHDGFDRRTGAIAQGVPQRGTPGRRRRRRRPDRVDPLGSHDQRCPHSFSLGRHDDVQAVGLKKLRQAAVRNSKPVDHSNLHHKIRFCSRPLPRAAPPAPPNAPKSCRTDQGPNRDAPAAAGPEQTGLADRAPAARSAVAAGSPQAARWQVRAAVSDPNCSRPAPGRPSGSGSAGAMSRVSRALREQRVEAA